MGCRLRNKPAKATAKLSMRLVADQDPAEVGRQLRAYLDANAPDSIEVDVTELAGARPGIMDRKSAYMAAAVESLRAALAWISRRWPTASADLPATPGRTPCGRLDILSSMPSAFLGPCGPDLQASRHFCYGNR